MLCLFFYISFLNEKVGTVVAVVERKNRIGWKITRLSVASPLIVGASRFGWD